MSLDPVLAAMMAQTIHIQHMDGSTEYGDPQYSFDFVEAKARVEKKRTIVSDANGEQVASDWAVYTQTEVNLLDRVWLPGTDRTKASEARLPKQVMRGTDEDGSTTHYEVMI